MSRIAFISENPFNGPVSSNNENMRTEFAWMYALKADHFFILNYNDVKDYDQVFVIFPKGILNLNAVGAKIADNPNPATKLLSQPLIQTLKSNNKKVHYIQEGPSWLFNEYEIIDQFNFYNLLSEVDSIFAHNEYDCKFYKGLFPDKPVRVIPTLLIEELIQNITPQPEEKVIIGGNFARWYGGFQSYLVADELGVEKWGQSSHAKRENEGNIHDLHHLPRITWLEWMSALSTFKYAVHLMPTIAAGTFSLNCAYFGIPCIGNEKVDTQRLCHPELSVDVEDVEKARKLAKKLKENEDFYNHCSKTALMNYKEYYNIKNFKKTINDQL
tara:strand:- start:1190 stop:2173 length:984 start_codon:yes stop_codon:yes gene_type:complete